MIYDGSSISQTYFCWPFTHGADSNILYSSGGSRICEKGGRESKFLNAAPGLKKSPSGRGGGGGGGVGVDFDTFFLLPPPPPPPPPPSFTWFGRGTIRLPDRPPGWQGEKRKEKSAEKEKENRPKRGGGGLRGRFAPWIRHCTGWPRKNAPPTITSFK